MLVTLLTHTYNHNTEQTVQMMLLSNAKLSRGAYIFTLVIRLHHIPMVKTIVFVIIIIILFSSQMKFSGQTRNLYRYGPQVDLRTLTHFQ